MNNITKNSIAFSILLLILSGCGAYDNIRVDNRNKLNTISAGLSKTEVIKIMGNESRADITNPYRTEMYKRNNDTFEILFYYTDLKKADDAITDDELTPVVIKNGVVDGWGWMYWESLVKTYELRVR